jgi:hypothetical protein
MKKICFAFLIEDIINQEEIWFDFFKSIEEKDFEIVIHSKSEPKLNFINTITNNIHINKVFSKWANLQKVGNFLLECAKDLGCDKLILLSNSCIPIKSGDFIFDYLNNDKHIIMYSNPWWYHSRNTEIFVYTTGNHQWCVIDKKHFNLFLEDSDRLFFEDEVTFPEECYFSSILNKHNLLNDSEVTQLNSTFTDWDRSPNGKSPYTFKYFNQYDLELINKLKHDNQTLFIRKVDKDFDKTLLY